MQPIGDLCSLVAPVPVGDFIANTWRKAPLHIPGAAQRAAFLSEQLGCLDIGLLCTKAQSATAWFTPAGTYAEIAIDPITAKELHAVGLTLYLQHLPDLEGLTAALAATLQLPPPLVSASVFASPKGAVTPWHFDQNDNFTVQLEGSKRWRLQANRHVELPTQNHVAGHAPREELALYAKDLPAREVLEAATAHDVNLLPGDVLYVPRGYWHEVSAALPSVSLSIACTPLNRIDLLRPELRAARISDPRWRTPCTTVPEELERLAGDLPKADQALFCSASLAASRKTSSRLSS